MAEKTIYKYQINPVDEQDISFPLGAELLTAQLQRGVICVWAKVESGYMPEEKIKMFVVGTGHELPKDATCYLGTVQSGPSVWHIYADRMIA